MQETARSNESGQWSMVCASIPRTFNSDSVAAFNGVNAQKFKRTFNLMFTVYSLLVITLTLSFTLVSTDPQ